MPLLTNGDEYIEKNVKELVNSYKRKGKIGTSKPKSDREARAQAVAIALSKAKNGSRRKRKRK